MNETFETALAGAAVDVSPWRRCGRVVTVAVMCVLCHHITACFDEPEHCLCQPEEQHVQRGETPATQLTTIQAGWRTGQNTAVKVAVMCWSYRITASFDELLSGILLQSSVTSISEDTHMYIHCVCVFIVALSKERYKTLRCHINKR